jgi:hypothetical protein
MSKRSELLQKGAQREQTIDTDNVLKKDLAALKSLEAQYEVDQIKADDAISAYLANQKVTLGEEFIVLLENKERIDSKLSKIQTIRETYLK